MTPGTIPSLGGAIQTRVDLPDQWGPSGDTRAVIESNMLLC